VQSDCCRFELALTTLDRALELLPFGKSYRAVLHSFRSDTLSELGRYAEAEASIAVMRAIARITREPWIPLFASWCEALLASYSMDRERTVRAMLDAERHRGDLAGEVSGLEFLAQGADLLDRVGEHEMALQRLRLARAQMAGFETTVEVFEAAVAGRSGNPAQALELLERALARPDLSPQERWPLLLLRAYAAWRGDHPRAPEWTTEAFATCVAVGHPEGPLLRERAVSEALLPIAKAAWPPTAAALPDAAKVSLTLLGTFSARRGGRALVLPPGLPARAVRAVAAHGGRMRAEELQEILWPGAAPRAGRIRLRNILSRVRAAAGELLVREEEAIALAPGTACDAHLFALQARAALDASADLWSHAAPSAGDARARAAQLARGALAHCRGDLLPDDRYEPCAESRRDHLRALHLQLVDVLAGEAESRGDVDEAVRQVERAIEAERYDEERYVRLASLLASQGRVGSARAALRRGRAALVQLGLGPSPSLEGLERALAETSRATV
jgi:DNA-binding SARP family transcriptional activator